MSNQNENEVWSKMTLINTTSPFQWLRYGLLKKGDKLFFAMRWKKIGDDITTYSSDYGQGAFMPRKMILGEITKRFGGILLEEKMNRLIEEVTEFLDMCDKSNPF